MKQFREKITSFNQDELDKLDAAGRPGNLQRTRLRLSASLLAVTLVLGLAGIVLAFFVFFK